jgi:hypothetical protein
MDIDKVIVVAPHWRGPEFQPVYLQLADQREHLAARATIYIPDERDRRKSRQLSLAA